MLGQNNISHVFVGAKTALSTGAVSALSAGQIGVYQNGTLTGDAGALTTNDKFQVFLNGANGSLINSPWIDYNNIVSANAVDYTAPTEKLVYVGYNGTTGSIAVNNSTVYTMHMNLQDGTKTWGEHPLFKFVAAYESDASATQTEIADALVVNAVKNFEREVALGTDYVEVGRISSAAVTAGNLLDHNATVVNGSNVVAVATNLTYAATVSTLAVGDYLRIGGVGAGTALTSGVYKVTAISTLNVILDRPVNEASGTYATATADIEVIPSATAIAANWGISFKTKPLAFDPGLKKYQKLIMNLQLGDGFGSTPQTVSTNASKGEGTYMEVAENEWLLKGNRGEPFRVASYPVSNTLNAVSTATYDTVVVHFTNNKSIQLDHEVKSYISLVFYVACDTAGTSGSTAYTNLKTVFGL
jgi:hypothetical protein